MRLQTVAIQNFRLIADATIRIPSGLTLVNGENGLGKSSIFQAILWCLYGPDALGDNQPSLVRQGTRDMSVIVHFDHDDGHAKATVTRKFSLSPNGKSGRTELALMNYLGDPVCSYDLSGATVAEAQANIVNLIGSLDVFTATAYVDQHDGPGAFLRSKPAEQRQQLRDLLNISPDWDQWFELAKLKHKTGADRIVGNLGRVGAAQEFIDQNGEVETERNDWTLLSKDATEKIQLLNLNLEDLQDENDEVDKVIAENGIRTNARIDNQRLLDHEGMRHDAAVKTKESLTALVANLPALDEERRTWLSQCDVWDDRNTEYQKQMRNYMQMMELWGKADTLWTEEARLAGEILAANVHGYESCPTCKQSLETPESKKSLSDIREAILAKHQKVIAEAEKISDQLPEDKPTEPVSPGTRPVFASEAEWNSAKSAENDTAAVDAEIKTRAEQVTTLEDARKNLPTPDDYDIVAYAARAQTIVKVNAEVELAETDKRDRERKLAAAENTLKMIEDRKMELFELDKAIATDEKLQRDLDIVVTGVGPNGARQLMIDQLLGDFQAEVNDWLKVLLPGFSIFMDTQAESGRETFETLFATPTGVIGWHGLSGAQRVGVGLACRRALASMYAQRTGHRFDTWIIDEADGAMRGEKRDAFVSMLHKMEQSGIDIMVVSHAGPVMERIEQRIEVEDAGGYTVVR